MTHTKNIKVGGNLSLPIMEFKLDSMCENPAIVMIAKRASGKSWVCRSILRHFRDIPVGIIIAPTEKMANPPFYSENYNLNDRSIDSIFTANIPLQPIEAGAAIVLKNIFFDSKKTELSPESTVELNKVIQLLKDNPQLKILITGHTDNVGKAADNQLLSNGRAESVIRYILATKLFSKDWRQRICASIFAL